MLYGLGMEQLLLLLLRLLLQRIRQEAFAGV